MNFFRKIKREYLDLPKNLRNGTLILLVLLFLVIMVPYAFKFFFTKENSELSVAEIAMLNHISDSIDNLKFKPDVEKKQVLNLAIDPNYSKTVDWVKVGLPSWLGERIVKYTEKGGRFSKAEDLMKIYGFTHMNLEKVEPFLVFSPIIQKSIVKSDSIKRSITNQQRTNKPAPVIEINTADSIEFEKLSGIGPVIASRIIKYRKLLGGFYKAEQLREVYGLNSETFEKIKSLVFADSSKIEKLDLLNTPTQLLNKHPYIGYHRANLILKFRKFENKITKKNLLENNIFTAEDLSKLEPYLK